MIKVRYEEYHNDYFRRNHEETFSSLTELEDWIFGQMQQDYTKSCGMYFPTGKHSKEASRISFTPVCGGCSIWIHQIEDYRGIIFSDGTFTSGQKHWSKDIREWLVHCDERQHAPKFTFVD